MIPSRRQKPAFVGRPLINYAKAKHEYVNNTRLLHSVVWSELFGFLIFADRPRPDKQKLKADSGIC